MQLTTEDREGLQVVRVSGELDTFGSLSFRESLTLLRSSDRIVVDLGEVSFVDSAGLHALFSVGRAAKNVGAGVVFVVPVDSTVRRVIDLVQLAHVSPVCDSLDIAVSQLRATDGAVGGLSEPDSG